MFTKPLGRQPDVQFRVNNRSIRRDLCSSCSFFDDEEFTSARYDLNKDEDWLKSKHRILLYPSSNEEKFSKRKMINPVPKAKGPRDYKCDEDDYHVHNFDWKGKRGSLGMFETKDLANRDNVHPLRLLYPKIPDNPMRDTTRNSLAFKSFDSTENSPHQLDVTSISKSDSRFYLKRNNEYAPAKYDINDKNSDWLKSKHRKLLYPSSSEEAFLERKMSNPVPKALGPRDFDNGELPTRTIKYNWKGKRGSVGDYETIDLDKNNIYPLRLMYPKNPKSSKVKLSNNDDDSDSWIDGTFSGKLKGLNRTDLNFESDEAHADDKYRKSCESSDTSITEQPYKWQGMHGNSEEYGALNNNCNGIDSICPSHLQYSRSPRAPNLTSVGEDEKNSSAIPKFEERYYDWKGRRGSLGDFETTSPSASMSTIFPLRMLYPKPQPSTAQSSHTKSREKKETKISDRNRGTTKVKEQELEERDYDWKGKRGSLGLFETVGASREGNIFPIRMIYPKALRNETRDRSCPHTKISKKQELRNNIKGLHNKTKYSNDSCANTSGTITPQDFYDTHELSDDSTTGSGSMLSVIELTPEKEANSNSLGSSTCGGWTNKEENRAWDWKGTKVSKTSVQQGGRARTFRVSEGELHSSLSEPFGPLTAEHHEIDNQSVQNVDYKNPGKENYILDSKYAEENLPQLPGYSSCATSETRWSEDDQTSVGKSISVCSSKSPICYKRDYDITPKSKKVTSIGLKEWDTACFPKPPIAKSKNRIKEKSVSMWPTEDQPASLPKIPEVKSVKDNKPPQRRKTVSGEWTPAKYDSYDPIADIKRNGIYAPLGLYSSRGSRQRSKSTIKSK